MNGRRLSTTIVAVRTRTCDNETEDCVADGGSAGRESEVCRWRPRAWRGFVIRWRRRRVGMSLRGFALWLAMFALAGCMVGPDFHPPATRVASQWNENSDPSVGSSLGNYRDWWSAFNDPTLTRLVEIAYRQNLTLLAAGVRVLQARAQLAMAIGSFYPQQQMVGASVAYTRLPLSNPFNSLQNTYWSDAFVAQGAWELDFWGKLRRAIQSADSAYLASVANYDDALVTLTADVARTYIQIRTLQGRIAIARDNLVKQRMALKIAVARHRWGVATKRDVDQATNVLGATEAIVPQLDAELAQAKNLMAVLLGRPPGEVDRLLVPSTGIPEAPPRIAVGIPADLLRRRPDVRRAELQAAAQCAQIGVARADLFPMLSLTGNVGTLSSTIGDASLSDVFTSASLAYSVGPSLQWKLLNYGQITNNVRMQDAKFQALLIDYQNTVLAAQQDVENGIALFIDSRKQVHSLKMSVAAAQDALRIALIQYKEGALDFTTVLTAEQNLYQAQNSLVVDAGAVDLGAIAIYRAMGGGWGIRAGHDFVPRKTRREMEDRTNWGTLLTPELTRPQAPGLPSPADTGPLVRPPEL
jgi:NodT family efflux transporter outer membrane factor (OMF) lipoprotein